MKNYIASFTQYAEPGMDLLTIKDPGGDPADAAFVIISNKLFDEPLYNLHIQTAYASPFKDIEVINGKALIGFGNIFVLLDIESRRCSPLVLDVYFGSFKVHNDLLYICSASAITCMDMDGHLKWVSGDLGIDGVIIHAFDNDTILCDGEWDPPGGWLPQALDIHTGKKLVP